jgi:predicted dehydrogenase
MRESIRLAVIGAGIMGQKHARIYSEMDGAELTTIVDMDENRAKSLAESCGAKNVYRDFHQALDAEQLDAVHVATPDFLHKEPVIAALRSGRHVLVEKPLAVTVADAEEIVRVSEETGCHVMVNYTHRWAAPYARTREIVRRGEIGAPVMVYARKDDTLWAATEMMNWTAKTSPASYLSTHDIDLVLWFLDTDVASVYALGVRKVLMEKNIDTEDAIQALVRFKNGAIGTFESCWVLPNSMPTVTDSFIEIVGEKGTIHIDRIHEGLKVATAHSYQYPKLSLESEVQGRMVGGIASCLHYFVQTLRAGETPQPDARWGLKIVRISNAIQASIKQQAAVRLDEDTLQKTNQEENK